MKQFWKSTNFWLSIVLLFGGAYVGFPEGAAGDAVEGLFKLLGGGGLVYNFLKQAKPSLRLLLENSNTYVYLGTILTAFWSDIPGQLFVDLEAIVRSILGGNWQGALVSALSFIGIIFRLVRDGHLKPTAAVMVLALWSCSCALPEEDGRVSWHKILPPRFILHEEGQFGRRLCIVYATGPQVQTKGFHPIPAAYLGDGG